MRKTISFALLVCMVTLLVTLSMPTVHATPRTAASGTWQFIPTPIGVPRSADGNLFMEATTEDVWTGTIEGEGGSVESVVIHEFVSLTETGFWNAKGLLTLDPCTVAHKSGILVIRYVGKGTAEGQWSGQWVILSGTDDLADLRGQGTWWGPDASGNFPYSGLIHFESD